MDFIGVVVGITDMPLLVLGGLLFPGFFFQAFFLVEFHGVVGGEKRRADAVLNYRDLVRLGRVRKNSGFVEPFTCRPQED
jgi:hypothetical protein